MEDMLQKWKDGTISLDEISKLYQFEVINHPHNLERLVRVLSTYILMLVKGKYEKEALEYANELFYRMFAQKTNHEGKYFYSFREATSYALDDLRNNTLSMVHPSRFNDPMDTAVIRWLEYKIQNETDDDKRAYFCMLQKASQSIRVRSLTSANSIEEISPLMWAHYAKYHQGYCVEYTIGANIEMSNPIEKEFLGIYAVKYPQETLNITGEMKIDEALLWKGKFWETEHESRMIYFKPNLKESNDVHIVHEMCPHAVYLGLKCSEETKQTIMSILSDRPTEVYEMKINPEDLTKLTACRIA